MSGITRYIFRQLMIGTMLVGVALGIAGAVGAARALGARVLGVAAADAVVFVAMLSSIHRAAVTTGPVSRRSDDSTY